MEDEQLRICTLPHSEYPNILFNAQTQEIVKN